MIYLQKILIVILLTITTQAFSGEHYQPDTGDSHLDASLMHINKKNKKRQNQFISIVASEYQVQREKVSELFRLYEFTAADVLMTLSIADVTGQPVNNISRAYYENKKQGWKFVLQQLDINKYTKEYKQIMKDAEAEFVIGAK